MDKHTTTNLSKLLTDRSYHSKILEEKNKKAKRKSLLQKINNSASVTPGDISEISTISPRGTKEKKHKED